MTTPMIHDLVRERRISPEQGARMLELRRSLAARRRALDIRRLPAYARIFVAIGTLVLAVIGIRRENNA